MPRTRPRRQATTLAASTLLLLAAPAVARADSLQASQAGQLPQGAIIDTLWVIVAGMVVCFMLAGLLLLEGGMSRGKNVGTLVAKGMAASAVAVAAYYVCGFAFAFGHGPVIGGTGFLLRDYGDPATAFPALGASDVLIEGKWFFQCMFCCITVGICWGSMLERTKFTAYLVFAAVFAGLIYPLASHQVFGGGWLQATIGTQDFAGSSGVHLTGAVGAFAGLLLLGPRRGKYDAQGAPRPIPGHNMLLLGLGMFILLLGWFGFNAGSTLGAQDGRFAAIVMITMLGGAGGIIGSLVASRLMQKTYDIGMICNGLIAGLVAITAPCGYVEQWTGLLIGLVGGLIVVPAIILIDRKLDDPVGVLSAHGLAGIWGTLSCGIFTSPRLASYVGVGNPDGGLLYSGSFAQLAHQVIGVAVIFAIVFSLSTITWWAIKHTIGLRVSEEHEIAGLDITEHGMYGYPEQFIPDEELYLSPPGKTIKLGGSASAAPAGSAATTS